MRRIFCAGAMLLLLAGCTAEKYGAGVDKSVKAVEIRALMLDPSLDGRRVNISGTINTQCASSGCWMFLDDGTAQVFINMAPAGFSLPPKYGRKATVTGTVRQSPEGVMVVADGVETS